VEVREAQADRPFDSMASTDAGEDAGFEAPRKIEEAETPGEQPALTHPHGVESRRALARC
jgi:hypothetical protein